MDVVILYRVKDVTESNHTKGDDGEPAPKQNPEIIHESNNTKAFSHLEIAETRKLVRPSKIIILK